MTLECLARTDYSYSENNVAFVQPIRVYNDRVRAISGIDVETVTKELIAKWHRETLLMSSPEQMKKTSSFTEIVSLGNSALPYVVEDLEQRPSLLMLAAAEITGENPITEGIRGDMRAMAGAWVGWYQFAKRERF